MALWSKATAPSCYDHTFAVAFQPLSLSLSLSLYLSRGHYCANTVGFGNFPGFCQFLVQCANILSLWGGGMCILNPT